MADADPPNENGVPDNVAENLERHRRGYEAGLVPVLIDVLDICKRGNYPLPEWANNAVQGWLVAILAGAPWRRRGSTGNPIARSRNAFKHFLRWDMVKETREAQEWRKESLEWHRKLLEAGTISKEEYDKQVGDWVDCGRTWEDAFEFVSKDLEGTFASGSPATIKKSYLKYEHDSKDPKKTYQYFLLSERTRRVLGFEIDIDAISGEKWKAEIAKRRISKDSGVKN